MNELLYLFNNGINFDCVSKLSEEKINEKKIKYYRYSHIHRSAIKDEERSVENLIKNNNGIIIITRYRNIKQF